MRVGVIPPLHDELIRLHRRQHLTQDERARPASFLLWVDVHLILPEDHVQLAHLLILPRIPGLPDEPEARSCRLPGRHPALTALRVVVQVKHKLTQASRAQIE